MAMADESGKRIFETHCAACHAAGPGHPGTQALALKYNNELPAELTRRTDLAPAYIMHFVRNGGGSMPFFRKTEISDDQLQLLIDWLANSKED